MLCVLDAAEQETGHRLLRPYFGMHRFKWSDDDSIEFHLPHGELIALLRSNGLEIEELVEVRPPDGSTTRYPNASLAWASADRARTSRKCASAAESSAYSPSTLMTSRLGRPPSNSQ